MSLKKRLEVLHETLWFAVFSICLVSTAYAQRASNERLIAIGWVQAAGEIRIYARKVDLGKLYDGSCISGVMTDGRTMPKKFTNRHVSVYGELVDAKDFENAVASGINAGVENYCNSLKIAVITRIVVNSSNK